MRKGLGLLLILIPCVLQSQSFIEVSGQVGINFQFMGEHYGGGASFYDVNKDGWDDLTLCQDGSDVLLYINAGGTFLPPQSVASNTGNAKSVAWVDYDNDGDPDLFVTRYIGEWTLLRNDGDIYNLIDVTAEAGLPVNTNYQTYGQAWGDYDRDGDLDLYVCNYNSDGTTNFFFENNGDGTFEDITVESNMGNGSVWSFQGSWLDYDEDLWPDLFVINDRFPASNTMYHNEEGVFNDVTVELGLDYFIFAMNISASDFDRDDDIDFYVSNGVFGNLLHRQEEDGTFSEVAVEANCEVNDHSWSAQWMDYDMDGYEDLHVVCSPLWGEPGQNRFFVNDQDGTFTISTIGAGFANDDGWGHCSVSGDFNNDGYFDLLVVNDAPDWTMLYQSVPGPNNYLKIGLEGTLSNKDGIGSWIEVWNEGQRQIRYTTCGEGYMTQNSQREIFGMGSASKADSIVIKWPSGFVDVFYDISSNQSYEFTEGQSLTGMILSSQTSVCEGDSVLLVALNGLNHTWNTGVENDSLWVTSPGSYFYTATNDLGVPFNSMTTTIVEGVGPVIQFESFPAYCAGEASGSISVNGLPDGTLIYLDGLETESEIFGLGAGSYQLLVIDEDFCQSEANVEITEPAALEASAIISEPLCAGFGGAVNLEIIGGLAPYTIEWNDINPDAITIGEYSVTYNDNNGCSGVIEFVVNEPLPLSVESELVDADLGNNGMITLTINGGTTPYVVNWSGPQGFTASGEMITDLEPGVYSATITDANGCLTTEVFILDGLSTGELNDIPEIYLGPNPTEGIITISGDLRQVLHLDVYDLSGRKVLQLNGQGIDDIAILDLSAFTAGQFIVVFTFEDHVQTFSILLEN